MAEARIREATEADDGAIGELLVTSFVEQYAKKLPEVVVSERRKAELRAVAEKRQVASVWAAEVNGVIVGTVALWLPGAKGSEAWLPNACDLRHLAVSDSARGSGVAKGLLDAAFNRARSSGAEWVVLHVRSGAEGVRRLYERHGFVRRPEGDIDALPEVFLEAFALKL